MEKEKPEKAPLEKKVAMRAMTRSIVRPEITVVFLETGRGLPMKTDKELLSCSSSTTNTGGAIMDKVQKTFPLLYVRFAFSVEKYI